MDLMTIVNGLHHKIERTELGYEGGTIRRGRIF